MRAYLGIDGGGTKTRALLISEDGTELHYAESGSSNLNASDEEAVGASLEQIIAPSIAAAGERSVHACLGLAGASSLDNKTKLGQIIERFGLKQYSILSDGEIALEAAFSGKPGVLLVVGTGSACLAKDEDGSAIRTGGWGWLADDGGSAGWIGQRALEQAVREYDGREQAGSIKDTVFEKLGIHSDQDIVTQLYQSGLTRAAVAELAPTIIRLADEGEPKAVSIRDAAVVELVALVRATSGKLKMEDFPIATTGGLVENNPSFRSALEMRLFDLIFQEPEAKPVEGAVFIAKRLAQSQ